MKEPMLMLCRVGDGRGPEWICFAESLKEARELAKDMTTESDERIVALVVSSDLTEHTKNATLD